MKSAQRQRLVLGFDAGNQKNRLHDQRGDADEVIARQAEQGDVAREEKNAEEDGREEAGAGLFQSEYEEFP